IKIKYNEHKKYISNKMKSYVLYINVVLRNYDKMDEKEILNSSIKSIFGAVPFVGSLFDELFFEYNGRIKQKRLNHFIEILADNFTQESDIKIENIQTEDFNDLFESVLRRVVRTKSEWKLNKFKDILI